MPYKHGVYVSENATSLSAPLESTAGLIVAVGTAPVNTVENPAGAVNVPILANNYAEAVAAVGFSNDFESYTLCDAIAAAFQVVGAGPMVLINVLDPAKHKSDVAEQEVQVNAGVATLEQTGMLLDQLVVKKDTETLTAEEDYTATFDDDGYLTIALIEGGQGAGAATLKISGKRLDAEKINAADIVGGVDVGTGKETGLEVIRQVKPKLGLVPGILIAPRWSKDATVAAALQTKCTGINGNYKAFCVMDLDSGSTGATKYTDVKTKKESAAMNSAYGCAIWPFAKVSETVYAGSSLLAALMAYTDANNGDSPNVGPDNQAIAISAACLEDGTEVYLDQEQANEVNGAGVVTWLNMNGWRAWGNNTAAYPSTTDPKDRWIGVRRFMSWAANTFIDNYLQYVGQVLNDRLIEAIVDSENMRGASFVSRGICARYEIEYNAEDNPTTELLNGAVTFRQYMSPFTPAETINDIIEFDPNALSDAMTV